MNSTRLKFKRVNLELSYYFIKIAYVLEGWAVLLACTDLDVDTNVKLNFEK